MTDMCEYWELAYSAPNAIATTDDRHTLYLYYYYLLLCEYGARTHNTESPVHGMVERIFHYMRQHITHDRASKLMFIGRVYASIFCAWMLALSAQMRVAIRTMYLRRSIVGIVGLCMLCMFARMSEVILNNLIFESGRHRYYDAPNMNCLRLARKSFVRPATSRRLYSA